jgi:hypothetical protein
MNDIESIERMLKAWKRDYENGRMAESEYLRMRNSWETRLRQLKEAK